MSDTIALVRNGVPALWQTAARGVVAILSVVAVVVPIICIGQTYIALFAAVLVGIYAGLWAGRHSDAASLIGVLLVPGVGIALAVVTDVQVFGRNPGTIEIRDAADHPFAAGLRFSDARVAREYVGSVDGQPRLPPNSTGTWRAAPIVPSDWQPTQPVPAWAIAEVSIYGPLGFRSPRYWSQPYRAGVRHVSDLEPAEQAVAVAIETHGLTSVRGAPLLYWVESPRAVMAEQRTTLGALALGGILAWLIFLIGEKLLGDRSRRPTPGQ